MPCALEVCFSPGFLSSQSFQAQRLAGLNPAGVLCEITLPNGTMSRMPDVIEFSKEHDMPVVTIEDIIKYRKENNV